MKRYCNVSPIIVNNTVLNSAVFSDLKNFDAELE